MPVSKEHLTILSQAEKSALYDLPEYNNEQRLEYLNLSQGELQIAWARSNYRLKFIACFRLAISKR